VTLTRSDRKTKRDSRLIKTMVTKRRTISTLTVEDELAYNEATSLHSSLDYDDPLLAYKAVSDPAILYFHEAMKEKDSQLLLDIMMREVEDQYNNGNFTVIHKSDVPDWHVILPAVWQMRRKPNVKTGIIKKYKARLKIDGSRMTKGIHYNETYSPVASWNSVRMLFTLTAMDNWHTKQIDYVQAFAQAPVKKTLFMPAGMTLDDGSDPKEYVLQIHRNIYGQKKAGRVWNKYLANKLVNVINFIQSKIDECVFYRGTTMYVLYSDDSLWQDQVKLR
jgi:Reverse transcriptase (RNA-dependent DNA polymerase)